MNGDNLWSKKLSLYIQTNEPDIKGFSDKNLWRMKQFYETYKTFPKNLNTVERNQLVSQSGYLLTLQNN
nr:DUF1016 N-terminal domain-containing protein [Chryseobacterium ginsenosidimutans]